LLLFGFLQEAGGAGAKPPTPSGEARLRRACLRLRRKPSPPPNRHIEQTEKDGTSSGSAVYITD